MYLECTVHIMKVRRSADKIRYEYTNTNTNTNTLLNLSTPVMYNSNHIMHYYNELANIGHLNNLNGIMGNMGHWIRIG
jgi:hypothetical protein